MQAYPRLSNAYANGLSQAMLMIPTPERGSISLTSLAECVQEISDRTHREHLLYGILLSLETLGAVRITTSGEEAMVTASSETAAYFVRSFGLHIKHGLDMIDTWQRTSGADTEVWSVPLLRSIETRRVAQSAEQGITPEPIRRTRHVSIFIKAKSRRRRCDLFLFQYNSSWRAYNVIGGKYREDDGGDLNRTAKRKMAEELRLSENAFSVQPLAVSEVTTCEVSKRCGAYTEYTFKAYQAFLHQPLKLSHLERWFTREEMLAGRGSQGEEIMTYRELLNAIERELPNGLKGLPYSLPEPVDERLGLLDRLLARVTLVQLIAAILTIVATLIGLAIAIAKALSL